MNNEIALVEVLQDIRDVLNDICSELDTQNERLEQIEIAIKQSGGVL